MTRAGVRGDARRRERDVEVDRTRPGVCVEAGTANPGAPDLATAGKTPREELRT
ncbi:MAG: hypothetical protein ACR2F6_11380 [Mycobacteriales bacterium]